MFPCSTARARTSASIRSFFLLCWPIPNFRHRVVSTINGSCPHSLNRRWIYQPSRHASNATRALVLPGPSCRSSSSIDRAVARLRTSPFATSQKLIFRPRSRATLRMVVLPSAPVVICAIERVGVSGALPPGGGTTSTFTAPRVLMPGLRRCRELPIPCPLHPFCREEPRAQPAASRREGPPGFAGNTVCRSSGPFLAER